MPRIDFLTKHPVTTPSIVSWARAVIVAALLVAFGGAIAGCGQRGPLYYPDKDNPDRRR